LSTRWTPEEDTILCALPAPVTLDCARAALRACGVERSGSAISERIRVLDLPRPVRGPWTAAEEATLLALLATGRSAHDETLVAALAAVGVTRTAQSISTRAYRLLNGSATVPQDQACVSVTPAQRRAKAARDFALINSVVARVFGSVEPKRQEWR
jgi:hypothetical protein